MNIRTDESMHPISTYVQKNYFSFFLYCIDDVSGTGTYSFLNHYCMRPAMTRLVEMNHKGIVNLQKGSHIEKFNFSDY